MKAKMFMQWVVFIDVVRGMEGWYQKGMIVYDGDNGVIFKRTGRQCWAVENGGRKEGRLLPKRVSLKDDVLPRKQGTRALWHGDKSSSLSSYITYFSLCVAIAFASC